MKKAIVFGATGQLGCYSALALKDDGFDVVAVGRRTSDRGFFATRGIRFIGVSTSPRPNPSICFQMKSLTPLSTWRGRCLPMRI